MQPSNAIWLPSMDSYVPWSVEDEPIHSNGLGLHGLHKSHQLMSYELLTIQYLQDQANPKSFKILEQFLRGKKKLKKTFYELLFNAESYLKSDLWFLGVHLEQAGHRLQAILEDINEDGQGTSQERLNLPFHQGFRKDLLKSYLEAHQFVELHLDSVFQYRLFKKSDIGSDADPSQLDDDQDFLPLELFKYCPNVELISLRNNQLRSIPPDIGRLKKLRILYLTNNKLQNRSLPYTLTFCSQLEELYLDHNWLDALPGFLLQMKSLNRVHRHGNHNYFKSTFMWYHTDVNDRILEEPGVATPVVPDLMPCLQLTAIKSILSSRQDFFQSQLPARLESRISELSARFNLCENCSIVRPVHESGFKVFTFKNPYLGNTCVPFLHWTCSKECAERVEIPARLEQLHSAQEQDRIYQQSVLDTISRLRPSQRSISSLYEDLSQPSSGSFQPCNNQRVCVIL